MSINLSSNFLLSTHLPLDARTIAADATARDATPNIQRYFGLIVTLLSDGTTWILADSAMGGVDNVLSNNANWISFGSLSSLVSFTFSAQNKTGSTILKGMAVAGHSSGSGVIFGNASNIPTQAIALCTADVLSSAIGTYQTSGLLTLADWTSVTGAVSLVPLANYFLSTTDGLLTNTAPSTPGEIIQIIGRATSLDTLSINLKQTILL